MDRPFVLILLLLASLGRSALADAGKQTHILFVIAEPEYDTQKSLTSFAAAELEPRGFNCSFALEDTRDTNSFTGLESIKTADLLFISARRHAPKKEQMQWIRQYIAKGGPVAGIRTASHAFGAKPNDNDHEGWETFDADVLGGSYQMHFGNSAAQVELAEGAIRHPIMEGLKGIPFETQRLYKNARLASSATPLLVSHGPGDPALQYVAWANTNANRKVFYTSLGAPADFEKPVFRKLLLNGILWAMDKPLPESKETPMKK